MLQICFIGVDFGLLLYLKLKSSLFLRASVTKQNNYGWLGMKEGWLKAVTSGCSEKNPFREISKIFKASEGIQAGISEQPHLSIVLPF